MRRTETRRIILHVDMDSFFASVEVRENPALKGLPVVVGADPKGGTGRGVVCTCSYEARRYGIRSAMPISEAYVRCPEAVYLPVSHDLYREVSGDIMDAIRPFADAFAQVSVDEAYCDISSCGTYAAAEEIGTEIRHLVKERQGITCSVGIGPNKTIAKIASDFNKPDGMTIVHPDDAAAFLAPLPVRKIPGIGKKAEERLASLGIATAGELAKADPLRLKDVLGKWGGVMHAKANGIDNTPVSGRGERKSIGKEYTFPEDVTDRELLCRNLAILSAEVCRRLRKEGGRCRTVTVKIRYRGFTTRTKAFSFAHATNCEDAILHTAESLLLPFLTKTPVRLIGVSVSGLERTCSGQMTLDMFSGGSNRI
ncbi:DNA polymerase IV [Methanogenium organophilum]|uniref:DNA polymerase IV n=1 Tax=Methanogenium organophilum TaxID=2199 RepID=A0A9X9S2B8_METOG|nr:DNA polymerase IV [Methanogenium organophilum]WAI00276.1 DNA polymerase IV [Methanogenium organophilum]